MLAWHGQERARKLDELADAIEHIDACFDAVSPIEDEEVLDCIARLHWTLAARAAFRVAATRRHYPPPLPDPATSCRCTSSSSASGTTGFCSTVKPSSRACAISRL